MTSSGLQTEVEEAEAPASLPVTQTKNVWVNL
jgi:hypothetical protein